MKQLDLFEIEKHYRIDDGKVWSYRLGRCLKPSVVNGYAILCLPDVGLKYIGVHRLVALKYLGERPVGSMIGHKDDNSLNNVSGNLEYVSRGRVAKIGRRRKENRTFILPEVMPDPRLKPVICDGKRFASVAECALELGMTRTGVYKAIKRGRCRVGDIGFARS